MRMGGDGGMHRAGGAGIGPLALAACAVLLAACSSSEGPQTTSAPPDASAPDAGPCPEEAALFGIDRTETAVALEPGTLLPITQGFQGFLFVSVGLRAKALPSIIDLFVHMKVEGKLDRTTAFPAVGTHSLPGGGMESGDVRYMFNDVGLADLVGQPAALTIWTTSPACILSGHASVRLTTGNFMGPDGGWDRLAPAEPTGGAARGLL